MRGKDNEHSKKCTPLVMLALKFVCPSTGHHETQAYSLRSMNSLLYRRRGSLFALRHARKLKMTFSYATRPCVEQFS